MFFSFLVNIISPHQMPLAKRLADILGSDRLRYVYQDDCAFRNKMGWKQAEIPFWCIQDASGRIVRDADVLLSGIRDIPLFEERCRYKQKTIYTSERWFKPRFGFFRMLSPRFFRMAYAVCRLLLDENFFYFPIGVYAAQDMARICGLFTGQYAALWRRPAIAFESRPGGVIIPLRQAINEALLDAEAITFAKRYGFVQLPASQWGKSQPHGFWKKMRMWGYFVEPSTSPKMAPEKLHRPKKILWVGRLLDWKKVDTLIRAVHLLPQTEYTLDIYGDGPQKKKLQKLAQKMSNISFHDFVPIAKVRELMRTHDIYVLASTQKEGWGAVLNEALEEKMAVLSCVGAGGGTTMLPGKLLFEVDDAKALAKMLSDDIPHIDATSWSAANAAAELIRFIAPENSKVENKIKEAIR